MTKYDLTKNLYRETAVHFLIFNYHTNSGKVEV